MKKPHGNIENRTGIVVMKTCTYIHRHIQHTI